MLSLENDKQASGFSVLKADELYFINGGETNATKYTYPDGSYMIVSNDGSFETKNFNADGSEKHMDGMCGDVSNAVPSDVNYDTSTGTVKNSLEDSVSSSVSYGGGSSGGGKA